MLKKLHLNRTRARTISAGNQILLTERGNSIHQDDDEENLTDAVNNETTAVTAILSGLKLRGDNLNGNRVWSQYKKTTTPYDIIIRINSLADLRTQGWEILLGEHVDRIIPMEMASEYKNGESKENIASNETSCETNEGVIVTVLGAYNRGKSFLLNQLCKVSFPIGNLMHTEGISITAGKDNYTNIVFLDTAGTDTPVKNDEIQYKRATEALLREVVLYLCTFVIIVVNRLRATDQIYIKEILKYCRTAKTKTGIIIVHNLLDIETIKDLEETIQNEIVLIFNARPRRVEPVFDGKARVINFFTSRQDGMDVRHFILAKSGSPAADVWNMQSFDGMMNIFQNSTEHQRNLNIIDNMISFVNTKLPHLLVRSSNNTQEDDAQQTIQIVQHDNQPYIVLSNRKTGQNLTTESCKVQLSEKLVYDNAGYFIRHDSEEWQPRYNLYEDEDKIRLILELPGFKKGECTTTLQENAVIVTGTRADFNKTSTMNTIIHQSEIPIGSFKLQIPLRCEIDTHDKTIIREDGFITITAPKKKINQEQIEI